MMIPERRICREGDSAKVTENVQSALKLRVVEYGGLQEMLWKNSWSCFVLLVLEQPALKHRPIACVTQVEDSILSIRGIAHLCMASMSKGSRLYEAIPRE